MAAAKCKNHKAESRLQKTDLKATAFCRLPTDFCLSNSAICVASANPLKLHSLDKLLKVTPSVGSMNRDD